MTTQNTQQQTQGFVVMEQSGQRLGTDWRAALRDTPSTCVSEVLTQEDAEMLANELRRTWNQDYEDLGWAVTNELKPFKFYAVVSAGGGG